MNILKTQNVVLLVMLCILTACRDKYAAIGSTEVLIETSEGDIRLRLYDDTPLHRDNFIKNAEAGAYNGILFNRIVPDKVIQAGDTTLKVDGRRETTAETVKQPAHTIPARQYQSRKGIQRLAVVYRHGQEADFGRLGRTASVAL